MAGVKISALPLVPSLQLTDIFPLVQAGVTYQGSLTQLQTLFNANLAFLPLSGGTMSGAINMSGNLIDNLSNPVSAQDAATKNYVDTLIANFATVFIARLASTAPLTVTYNNGTAGVGATLTNAGAMVAFALDGVSANLNDLVLIKNQGSSFQNGYYKVTTVGSGAVNWVLTRTTNYDQPSQIQPGDLFVITAGSTQQDTSWIETASVTTIGSDPITFSQYSAALPVPVSAGGTGATTASGARSNLSAAQSGANSDITSMSGLTGYLQAPLGVKDSSGNIVVAFDSTASAVNYINLFNNSTTGAPGIQATGSDASVTLALQSKGGIFQFVDYTSSNASLIRLFNAALNAFSGFQAAPSGTNIWTLPTADGSANAPLITDGSHNLSFLPGAWIDFSGSIGFTGFSVNPTVNVAKHKRIGKTCFINISATSGTSNATSFTITNLPFTAASAIVFNIAQATDNSSNIANVSGSISASGTTITMYVAANSSAWTNSGSKGAQFEFFYETT